MKRMNESHVNCFCLKKQHLTEDSMIDDVLRIIEDIGGLHATSSATTYISLFIRAKKFKRQDLDNELYEKRNLGKVRYVRATIYILPKEMIPTAFSAVKSLLRPMSKRYCKYYGITQKDYKDISKKILEVIAGKDLAAKEVRHALGSDMKVSHVLNLMCDSGLLIRGRPKYGWKSTQHTYHRMDEYFPDMNLSGVSEEEAKSSLVRLYISCFGPVTLNDISWWTKFTKTEIEGVLEGFEGDVTEVELEDLKGTHFMLNSQERFLKSTKEGKKGSVVLLPCLDSYLMGYKDRRRYLEEEHYNFIFDRSGNGTSSIMIDGKIRGIWDYTDNPAPTIKLHLFDAVDKKLKREIESKGKAIGRFIADSEVLLKECKEMVPLNNRTAGAVMSPLKGC